VIEPTAHLLAQESARDAAQKTLRRAARFAALHATARPLFQKTMSRPGSPSVLVRIDWPGVLSVYDAKTGERLALGLPGDPYQLDADTKGSA